MTSTVDQRAPGDKFWAAVWTQVWWLLTKLPAGEQYSQWLQLRHPINLHKGLSLVFCVGCMHLTDCWTHAACVYSACHGVYGVSWLLKEWLYRDSSWETPCTLGSAVLLFVGMGVQFWSNIVLLTSSRGEHDPTPVQLCLLVTVYTLGIWLHHTSDVQKYFVLRAKRGLITDGLFSRSRNPNYLGEMFIYGSFAGFVWNHPLWWWPWLWLVVVWTCLFYPSWLAKDRSMSRYPAWAQYTAHTGLIIPWPFGATNVEKEM